MEKKRLMIISPHFSTGGAPQVTLNKVELLQNHYDIMVVEYAFLAWNYVVQRNKVINILGDKFKSLGENKNELFDFIESFDPHVISMEEFPEMFMDRDVARLLYAEDRKYKLLESTHDSSFNPDNKEWLPDEFVFVSGFSMLQYAHLQVPMRVIEYPVNLKVNKPEKKVNLYVDVCIVGLWTPRKNQAYAIEIARKLEDYNIRFHFLGNQAGNFQSYWEPLMKDLPVNCIVHGEVNDVPSFVERCDAFLFTSKGEKNNKELNPIAIKEAMEHPTMPKFLFNLDVYLNKYNEKDDVSYLSGQVEADAQLIKDKLQLKEHRKELIVIGTFPNTEVRENLTVDSIDSHRALNRDILLVSHHPVPADIQKMVDYYIYDKHNPLIDHSYYNRFTQSTSEYSVELRIGSNSNQSLAVLTNLMNAYKFAKQHGYTHLYYNTFDVTLDERDIPAIEEAFAKLGDEWKAYLATLSTPFGHGIQTNGMVFDVDIMPKFLDDVRSGDDFNQLCNAIGAQNFLEDYFIKRAWRTEKLWLVYPKEETFLTHSGLGVSSNSEYYGVLLDESSGDKYFYFYTYNVLEDRLLIINNNRKYDLVNEKSILFKLENETSIQMEFVEEDAYHPSQTIELDVYPIGTIVFRNANIKRPKIKLVHIQTTINDEREQQSRKSLEQVRDHGWEYILHRNDPYQSLPPKHNCIRPNCVSMELFDEERVRELGTALTPAHYGCYQAFRDAILSEFDGCDYLIVCEGDCLIEGDVGNFIHKVEKCALMLDKSNIQMMSFGDKDTLEYGWPQSPVMREVNEDMYVTNHLIGMQCIMFPKSIAEKLKTTLRTHAWDAADIYFNTIFQGDVMGIVYKRLTTQADGYSLIDKQFKTFRK